MNKIELALIGCDNFYDLKNQPFKKDGIYKDGVCDYVFYGKKSEKFLLSFVKALLPKILEKYHDYVIRGIVTVDFISIKKGKEHLLFNHIDEEPKRIKIVVTPKGKILSIKKSKRYLKRVAKKAHIQTLEGIANWVDDPKNIFNTFDIYSFADEHFDKSKELRPQYLALAKKHHPDISNDNGLMFRAIQRTYEYLKRSENM